MVISLSPGEGVKCMPLLVIAGSASRVRSRTVYSLSSPGMESFILVGRSRPWKRSTRA